MKQEEIKKINDDKMKKQSFTRRDHIKGTRGESLNKPRLVLVDDVLTSGATLRNLSLAYPEISKTYLTLARVPDKSGSRARN